MKHYPRKTYFNTAVVGAGLFGCAAAKYLSKNETRVILIGPEEPTNKQIASFQQVFGAHYDQARITRRLGWDKVWGTIDSRSLNRFRNIENESTIPFFYEIGSLVIMAKSIASRTESIINQCNASFIPIERMSSESIEYHWPYFRVPPILGGIEGLFEDQMAGYLNPRRLLMAQLALFKKSGGNLLRGTVINVDKEKSTNLWKLFVLQNGRVNVVYSRKILIAAGAFINYHQLLPAECKLELYTFTEPNLLFEMDALDIKCLKRMPTVITVDPEDTGNENMSIYLLPPIQYPDGKWYIRLGPGMQPIVKELETLEEMREWYIQQKITFQQHQFLIQMQQMLMPNIKPKSIQEACCIIEKTPTHYPYIGQVNEDHSFTVVTGGNGHGARGSDEIGRLAAEMVLGKKWDFPIEQNCFKPILMKEKTNKIKCSPPFGLC